MRKVVSLVVMLVLCTTLAFAQNRVVTGTVTDDKGDPVPFASIKVKNGKAGVSADANGNFKIEVKEGTVLIVSATGSVDKEVKITGSSNIYNVTIVKSNTELSTVVVSALGIRRSVKSTPYAVQQISGERLTQTRETDLTSALSGKIAGVKVNGQAGSKLGSNGTVRLRGVAGVSDDQAIYVVDGTIVTNASDINMDDVANVAVLKGPNATALYGQRATGGVIIITTKKAGKGKPLSIEFNSTTTIEKVATLPDYQNVYGGGNSPDPNNAWAESKYVYKAGQPIEWKALEGIPRQQYYDDASWGPKMNGQPYIPWYAFYGGHDGSYKPAAFSPQPNNIKDFYQTGLTTNNNISLSKGGKWWSGRVGYTYLTRKGIIPNSDQTKHFISTQNSFDITSKLVFSTNIGVTIENFKGDFSDNYANNTTGSFSSWFHRNLDMGIMKKLRNLRTPNGNLASWNISDDNWSTPSVAINNPAFWYNPYSWLDNLDNKTNRLRIMGDAALAYKITKDLKLTGTYRMNYRTTELKTKLPFILEQSQGTFGYSADELGVSPVYSKYRNNNTKYTEQNFELIGQYSKKISDFSIDVVGGGNVLDIRRDDSSRSTNGGLVKQDTFEISNSASTPSRSAVKNYRQVRSLFARATIGYKDFLFMDLTGRNDWSSTLPQGKNSYFYPSAGLSFIFSDFVKNSPLSYGKLRVSAAQIGTDPLAPYALEVTYAKGTIPYGNTDTLSGVPNSLISPNIVAPINTSYEAGLELRFFRDRIGIAATYYNETRKNEIVSTDISSATGYLAGVINAGEINRHGIELELNVRPIVSKNFTWDVSFNWATNTSVVKKVSDQTNLFTIYSNYVSQPIIAGIVGQQWGQIRSPAGVKRINGLPVIGMDGLYETEENVNFGTVLPNYTGGIFNSFNYKGIILSASLDFQQGGKYFSFTDMNGKYSGLTKETADINDKGVNVREPLAQGGGVHVYGVLNNGKPYDTYVRAYDYFRQLSSNNIWDYSIFDASYLKLREVSLGYEIPVKKLGSLSKTIKKASISMVARNLWLIYTKNRGIDPSEIAETYAENGQQPGTRSLGINLKIGF